MKAPAAALALLAVALAAATTSPSAERFPVCGPYRDVPREGDPLLSRNGRVLVWTRTTWRRFPYVYVSAPDGSGAKRVYGRARVVPSAIAPDGSEVLLRWDVRSGPDWILVSTLNPSSRRVEEREALEIRRRWRTPEWSPDGRFVAESRLDGLWVVSSDGESRRRLLDLVGIWGPAWSPDGTQIAFGTPAEGPDTGSDLYIVNGDGTGLRRLTETGSVVGLSWSPDGRWIAFDSDRSHYHEGSAIAVVRPDGSGLRYLTRPHEGPDERSAGDVSWLNANRLVFVSDERRPGPRKVVGLHTIAVDGRDERRLTYHCHLGTPAGDALHGSILGDTMRSLGGADEVLPGPGSDDVDSGAGADLIRARDRERDAVRCGSGRDRVLADRRDRVARDCERVVRK
jgi:WD40-like Beta Propeller Repeat